MRHLLVTNDFPPKVGGIQSYLWELWRRLPSADVTVLTTPHAGAAEFDAAQAFRVIRSREPVLLPQPWLVRQVNTIAAEVGAHVVVLDPAVPLGLIGPQLHMPYAVVLHGAEVTVPARLPLTRQALRHVLRNAVLLIAGGHYPEGEARRALAPHDRLPPVVQIPPGVDTERFTPVARIDRAATRARLRLPVEGPLVLSVSRLVPRKGMDTLVDAATRLRRQHPDLTVAIAGTGRDRWRLSRRIESRQAPVRLLGRVADDDLPALYGSADVFALCCRTRWGGLEQEGFGIVLLEAAAAGVASVAGDSGGAAEAVADGETGIVVRDPHDAQEVADALDRLLGHDGLARELGLAARRRVEEEFDYDGLAARLRLALEAVPGAPAGPAATGPIGQPAMSQTHPGDYRAGGRSDARKGPHVEERVSERTVIRGTRQQCFDVLTEFEHYPDWAADIKAVSVDERDIDGRATLVTYRAAAFGRSTSYTLRYDYSAAPDQLSWVQVDGDLTRRLEGAYVLVPDGDDATEISYTLTVELKVPLPGFVKRRAEGRIMGTALWELKARVEGSETAASH